MVPLVKGHSDYTVFSVPSRGVVAIDAEGAEREHGFGVLEAGVKEPEDGNGCAVCRELGETEDVN